MVSPPRAFTLAAVALTLAACPGPSPRAPSAPPALTIPATADAGRQLANLAKQGRAGDVAAAWTRAHYLLDLFDDARFRGDPRSRALLTSALGIADARGDAGTDAALDALRIEVDGVLARDRLHAGASAARVMLEMDRHPPARRTEVFQRMTELKAAGRVAGLAANAALRRSFYCLRALEDTLHAPPPERTQRLSHCLYPLYDADPEAYFAADPNRRPPPPRWKDLVSDAKALLNAADGSRLARAADAVRHQLETLAHDHGAELPVEPSADALKLPDADHGVPYDGQPMLQVDADTDAAKAAGPPSLAIEGDGRGELFLPLAADAPRARFDAGIDTARRAGAAAVELGVVIAQTLEVPDGDYWAVHGRPTTVHRVAGVRLALATDATGSGAPSPGLRSPLWDPDRARLGLRLVIDATHWQLSSPGGAIGEVDATSKTGDPRTQLRVLLGRVQSAFPDERGLVIVTRPDAPYASIARAVASAAYDDAGHALFPLLALGDEPTPAESTGQSLAQRIERRWRARVDIRPDELANVATAARRCYMDLLDTHPALAGTVHVTAAGATASAGGTLLEPCATDALHGAMAERHIDSAEITFAPK